ncbi:hypothetical protein ES332_D13G167700v1 [Gossypium tomentosum]|uniref:Uncharacterized protein n=1 Tax=Gossypium tomentosum TaxID=34277 RepID=A0A5D2HY57_GOSTO|nr:hypothetical protein ES332_D13G167700v1 [Gossypium tomentosum]TYH35059.1 hypothetical protein ES332_D13G167700v1 [Gossypium tomentosum]
MPNNIFSIAFFILKSPHVGQLSFDTRSLSIHQVLSPITLSPLPFFLSSSPDPVKGTQLSISLPDDDVLNSFFIVFSTSPSSSALQWLSPPQTFNKKTPFCIPNASVSTRVLFSNVKTLPQRESVTLLRSMSLGSYLSLCPPAMSIGGHWFLVKDIRICCLAGLIRCGSFELSCYPQLYGETKALLTSGKEKGRKCCEICDEVTSY